MEVDSRGRSRAEEKLLPESKRQRTDTDDHDRWWDSGFVYGCDGGVRVALMSLKDGAPPSVRVCSITASNFPDEFRGEYPHNTGFAVVESKLYAFGGAMKSGISEFPLAIYSCDLGKVTSPDSRSEKGENELLVQFEKANVSLNGPKVAPIAVPYKNEKIFIMTAASLGVTSSKPVCEVLNLSKLNEPVSCDTLEAPYWMPVDYSEYPRFEGHAVVGKELYVCVVSRPDLDAVVWCLDMDNNQWRDPTSPPPTNRMDDFIRIPYDRLRGTVAYVPKMFWNGNDLLALCDVYDGKLFEVWRKDRDNPTITVKKFSKGGEECEEGDLHKLNKFFKDTGGGALYRAWVIPYDKKDNPDVYCIIVLCLYHPNRGEIRVCKFKLDDKFDYSSTSFGCEILSQVVDECGSFDLHQGWPILAFTPFGNKVLEFQESAVQMRLCDLEDECELKAYRRYSEASGSSDQEPKGDMELRQYLLNHIIPMLASPLDPLNLK